MKHLATIRLANTFRESIRRMESGQEPDDVDGAVYALRSAVSDLIDLRHSSLADRVMDEERAINAAFYALAGLVEDLCSSRLEAAE